MYITKKRMKSDNSIVVDRNCEQKVQKIKCFNNIKLKKSNKNRNTFKCKRSETSNIYINCFTYLENNRTV